MKIIRTGRTRVVILTERYAIKVARPGIGYCLRRIYEIVSTRETKTKIRHFRTERGGICRVALAALFCGLIANIREYQLARRFPKSEMAPTIFTIGIINVQRRGEEVLNHDIQTHPLVMALREPNSSAEFAEDMLRAEQFCRIDGKVRLVDGGNPTLASFIAVRFA